MRKLTHEEFLKRLQQISPNIEILGTYINCRTKIKCKCKLDGHEWEVFPKSLLAGHGCPKCGGIVALTTEEFKEKLYRINPNIEVLGTYINDKTKIKCKCKIDGYEWTMTPNNLLQGQGCPECGRKRATQKNTKTQGQFITELYRINPNIEILGTYINSKTKIKCRCKIDGHEWEAMPKDLLHRHGCPKCKMITHEEFIERLQQINPDIEILETYINARTKIKCRCAICGHEWKTKPCILLSGHGCPKCKISKGEKRIAQYLDNIGIYYIYDNPYFNDLVGKGGGLMRPDFIIPSLKIWIEYDGIQHYEPKDFRGGMSAEEVQQLFEYTQQNDQIKNQYAKDNNWILVRIPFTEYDNIEQILAEYIEQEKQVI